MATFYASIDYTTVGENAISLPADFPPGITNIYRIVLIGGGGGGGGGAGGRSWRGSKNESNNTGGATGGSGGSGETKALDVDIAYNTNFKIGVGGGGPFGTKGWEKNPNDPAWGEGANAARWIGGWSGPRVTADSPRAASGGKGGASYVKMNPADLTSVTYSATGGYGGGGAGPTWGECSLVGFGAPAVTNGNPGSFGTGGIYKENALYREIIEDNQIKIDYNPDPWNTGKNVYHAEPHGCKRGNWARAVDAPGGAPSKSVDQIWNGYGQGGSGGKGAWGSEYKHGWVGTSGNAGIVRVYYKFSTFEINFWARTNTTIEFPPHVTSISNTRTILTTHTLLRNDRYVYNFPSNASFSFITGCATKNTFMFWLYCRSNTTNVDLFTNNKFRVTLGTDNKLYFSFNNGNANTYNVFNTNTHDVKFTHYLIYTYDGYFTCYVDGKWDTNGRGSFDNRIDTIKIGGTSNVFMYNIRLLNYTYSDANGIYNLYASSSLEFVPTYEAVPGDFFELNPTGNLDAKYPGDVTTLTTSSSKVSVSIPAANSTNVLIKNDPAGSGKKTLYFNGQSKLVWKPIMPPSNTKMFWLLSYSTGEGNLFYTRNYLIKYSGRKMTINHHTIPTAQDYSYSGTQRQVGAWIHYAIAKDVPNKKMYVYVNGNLDQTITFKSDEFTDFDWMTVGDGYTGYMCGVRFYPGYLTEAQIKAIMSDATYNIVPNYDNSTILFPVTANNAFPNIPPYTITFQNLLNLISNPVPGSPTNDYVYTFNGNYCFCYTIPVKKTNTRMMWIYTDTSELGTGDVFCSTNYRISFNKTKQLNIIFNSTSASPTTYVCPVYQNFAWTHYAITCDGTNYNVYINGISIRNAAGGLTADDFSATWIGGYEGTPGFIGHMYGMQSFNRALSAAEIINEMNKKNLYVFSSTPYAVPSNKMLKYPPTMNIVNPPLNTDTTTYNEPYSYCVTTSGNSYGNGKYYIISSAERTSAAAYFAFTPNHFWQLNFYDKDPNKVPLKFTPSILNPSTGTSTTYRGEYLKLICPESFFLYYYTISYAVGNDPRKWVIAGSNNNTTWTLIETRDYSAYSTSPQSLSTFTISNPNASYSMYVFIFQQGYGDYPALKEIAYYGKSTLPEFKDTNDADAYNKTYNYTNYANLAPSDYTSANRLDGGVMALDACYTKCNENTKCKAFTHDIQTGSCNLFDASKDTTSIKTSALTTYVKHNDYFKVDNYDAPGNDIQQMQNIANCKTQCDSDLNCVGYIINKNNNTCFLKNAYTGTGSNTSTRSSNNSLLYMKTVTGSETKELYNFLFTIPPSNNASIPGKINGHPLINNGGVSLDNDPTGGSSYFMYKFSGNNSLQLNIPTPVKYSILFWVYLSNKSTVSANCNLFSSNNYKIVLGTDKIVKIILTLGNQTMSFKKALDDNKWRQFAVVSDGKNVNMYVGDTLDSSSTINQTQSIDNSVIKFGEGFQGFMYGMRMYPYALTSDNVKTLFNLLRIKTISEVFDVMPPLRNNQIILPKETTTTSFQMTWSTIASNRDGTFCMAFSTSNTMYISLNLNNWGDATKLTSLTKAPATVNKCVISDDGSYVVIATQSGLYYSNTSNRKQFSAWQMLGQPKNYIDAVISSDNKIILGAVDKEFVYISTWNAIKNAYESKKINDIIVAMFSIKLSLSQNGQVIMITGIIQVDNYDANSGKTEKKNAPLGWISEDGGNNFRSLNNDMLSLDNSYSYKHAMSNDGKTIVLGTKYFYISYDYGNNWNLKFTNSIEFNTKTGIDGICGGNYENIFINDNGNIIVANDSFNMYVSIDSGKTWSFIINSANTPSTENPSLYRLYNPICLSRNGNIILYGISGLFRSIQYVNIRSILPTLPPTTRPVITRSISNTLNPIVSEIDSSLPQTEAPTEAPIRTPPVLPTFPPTPRPIQPRSSNQNKFPLFNRKNLMYNQVNRQMRNFDNFETMSMELEQMLLPDLEDERFRWKNFNQSGLNGWTKEDLKKEIRQKLEKSGLIQAIITPKPDANQKYTFDLSPMDNQLKFKTKDGTEKLYQNLENASNSSNKQNASNSYILLDQIRNENEKKNELSNQYTIKNQEYERTKNIMGANQEFYAQQNKLVEELKKLQSSIIEKENAIKTMQNQLSRDQLSVSVQDNTTLSGNLFTILNTQNMQKPQLNNDLNESTNIEYVGETEQKCKFTRKCRKKHNYHPNCETTIDKNGNCNCVCSDVTLIGEGEEHSHCENGNFNDLVSSSTPSETFDALFNRIKRINIQSNNDVQPQNKIHDPGMNELLELVSNYYILLLKNKEMFDKMEDVVNLTNTTALFHEDANTEYRTNFTKIVNLGMGIGISVALIMMFRSK